MNPALLSRAMLPLLLLLPAGRAPAAPVPVDPQAQALLQEVQTATRNMHSLTADFTDIYDYQNPNREFRNVGVVKLMKPNYAFEQHWNPRKNKSTGVWEKGSASMTHASDGKTAWLVFFSGEYRKDKADPHGRNVGSDYTPLPNFFNPAQSMLAQVKNQQANGQLLSLTDGGVQIWEGHPYHVVNWQYKPDYSLQKDIMEKAPGGVVTESDTLYIGSDNLIHRIMDSYNIGWSGERTLRNVRVNAPLTAANFKLTLPPGAQLSKPYVASEPPKPLLANGTPAPDFAATAPDGSTVHLSDYKGKTVVLDFWATWCPPCQAAMPHLEKVYQQVKDKNVAVLGVCVFDDKAAYDKWVTDKKGTYDFPTAFDPAGRGKNSIASKLYHVSGIPTQYVIDKDGKIAASMVGYDEKGTELEDTLKKQGTEIVAAAKP